MCVCVCVCVCVVVGGGGGTFQGLFFTLNSFQLINTEAIQLLQITSSAC